MNGAALARFLSTNPNRNLNQEQINQFMTMGNRGNMLSASAAMPPTPILRR